MVSICADCQCNGCSHNDPGGLWFGVRGLFKGGVYSSLVFTTLGVYSRAGVNKGRVLLEEIRYL